MTTPIETLILSWLDKLATPGALDAHFWHHPEEWIEMQRYLIEDANAGDAALPPNISQQFSAMTMVERPTKRRLWRNWSLDHIEASHRLYAVAALHPAAHLSQPEFNFLTAADHATRRYGVKRPAGHINDMTRYSGPISLDEFGRHVRQQFRIDAESRQLAEAFARQMVEEAEPYRHQAVIGSFEMERVPLEWLDAHIDYDTIRLVIDQRGIAASLIKHDPDGCCYSPLWWSPGYFTGWSMGGEEAFALQVMFACIWRDACVVRERTFGERRQHRQPAERPERLRQAKLVLPRVRLVAWSTPEERERITRSQHTVRHHYRLLPAGWKTSQQAIENARRHGQPPPPAGWTFVSPHQRGTEGGGTVDLPVPVTPVVCTGLQTALIALSVVAK